MRHRLDINSSVRVGDGTEVDAVELWPHLRGDRLQRPTGAAPLLRDGHGPGFAAVLDERDLDVVRRDDIRQRPVVAAVVAGENSDDVFARNAERPRLELDPDCGGIERKEIEIPAADPGHVVGPRHGRQQQS
jgi:hypothetical protein